MVVIVVVVVMMIGEHRYNLWFGSPENYLIKQYLDFYLSPAYILFLLYECVLYSKNNCCPAQFHIVHAYL